MLEHFGFMEFLNLQHSGERDSELAQKKENFDNHVMIENERKHAKKEKQLRGDMMQIFEQKKLAVPTHFEPARLIKPTDVTRRAPEEIYECYLKPVNWSKEQ